MERLTSELVVLGAGPAGLAAAWRAARAGRSVVVLERGPVAGGMAASMDVAGVRVDHGSHRLHPATSPEVLADLRGLLGEDLQLRPRHGRLRIGSSWVGFPLQPAQLAASLPRGLVGRIAAEAVLAPLRRRSTPPASYADALRRSLGPGLYGAVYGPFAEKLWGLPGEEIDAEQARRRVTADTPWKIAARVLRGARGSGQGRVFHYPRRGFGQLTEAVAQAATDAGARIELRAEAVDVVPAADRVLVRTADGREIDTAHVFSTVPLPVLGRLVRPGPPAEVLAAASGLRFRAMVLVYLVLDRRPWTEFDAHYVPGPATPVTRVSEPANYRVSADDPAGRTVLCAEVPCAPGDRVWSAGDAELGAQVADDLARLGLPHPTPVAVVTRRLPHVYPVYDLGYAARLAGLDTWAASLPRVTTFGRLGLFAHDNTHHAVAMAYDAVDALGRDGALDRAAWARARERFAAHVVED
ncbi:protoporphyrinogen/coproporphyrinogen oxidase [Pseudonocardia sp.]|uniref:protoporphyrinogen/coproporphyrinogen oxidase n=1 Tax=Pseudonocardia sp. TaxID=60912 RepID=UPI003D0C5F80